ncbi:hypothetical protein BC936DRAFT_149416 [Jimgerdemannia flammicorona]|uniref:Uncharacterized protein n=1 Tax=Jimgerdemannia flammicorona TaxID=994334 RepID=A0A433D0W1_9FUNG|nr:hypothetical protein BC936DRAFT_149416 [Jimgerdemannia flammicorona]
MDLHGHYFVIASIVLPAPPSVNLARARRLVCGSEGAFNIVPVRLGDLQDRRSTWCPVQVLHPTRFAQLSKSRTALKVNMVTAETFAYDWATSIHPQPATSFAELRQRAAVDLDEVDVHPLEYWIDKAGNLFDEAEVAHAKAELENAYVLYMRASR